MNERYAYMSQHIFTLTNLLVDDGVAVDALLNVRFKETRRSFMVLLRYAVAQEI